MENPQMFPRDKKHPRLRTVTRELDRARHDTRRMGTTFSSDDET